MTTPTLREKLIKLAYRCSLDTHEGSVDTFLKIIEEALPKLRAHNRKGKYKAFEAGYDSCLIEIKQMLRK